MDSHTQKAELQSKLEKFRHDFSETPGAIPERIFGLYPRGYMSILASPPGLGKTWLTLYLCACGSEGVTVLGEKSRPVKAVIMSGETGVDLLLTRIRQTEWEIDKSLVSMYSAFELSMAGINPAINTPEGRAVLLNIIERERPDVVIFDTLISFHSFDESDQKEMTRVYLYLCKLAATFSFAIVLNHHTRKRSQQNPNKIFSQDDVIGSSSSIRLASDVYILQDMADEGATGFYLMNVKSWGKRIPTVKFLIHEDDGRFDFTKSFEMNSSSIRSQVRDCVFKFGSIGSAFRPKEMSIRFRTSEKLIRRYLSELTVPDEEDGAIVLKPVSLGGENMFVGNLSLGELSAYKQRHNIETPKGFNSPYVPFAFKE